MRRHRSRDDHPERSSAVSRLRQARQAAESAGLPVSYAGTQVNIFGRNNQRPNRDDLAYYEDLASAVENTNGFPVSQSVPNFSGPTDSVSYPYHPAAYPASGYTNNIQLGLVTEHMLRRLDETRMLALSEMMRRACTSQPYVQEPLSPTQHGTTHSRGNGDWKCQLQHINNQLELVAQQDQQFRRELAEPQFGQLTAADLEETRDSYRLVLTFDKTSSQMAALTSAVASASARRYYRLRAPVRSSLGQSEAKVQRTKEERRIEEYEREPDIRQEGTLKPYGSFNARQDAERLRSAMKGLGTDEQAIIDVLCRRSGVQRMQIVREFKTLFGKDLVKELKSELSGNFWKVMRALCMSPAEYDASELRDAIQGFGTDDACLIEIICTRNNRTLYQIKEAYARMKTKDDDQTTLEDDVLSDTSGHYQRLLVALLQANRDETTSVDRKLAKQEAELLYKAGAQKWGTDESRFNAILCSRSFSQLRATFAEYARLSGQSIEQAIDSEMSGNLAIGLTTLVVCIRDKTEYFAQQIYNATKGLGTADDVLVRVVVTRAEVDMKQIKQRFQEIYGQSMAQMIADDTSGDYRASLMALLGETKPAK